MFQDIVRKLSASFFISKIYAPSRTIACKKSCQKNQILRIQAGKNVPISFDTDQLLILCRPHCIFANTNFKRGANTTSSYLHFSAYHIMS